LISVFPVIAAVLIGQGPDWREAARGAATSYDKPRDCAEVYRGTARAPKKFYTADSTVMLFFSHGGQLVPT